MANYYLKKFIMNSNSLLSVVYEYNKMRILNKNYGKNKLTSCIIYMLGYRDDYTDSLLDTISKLNNYKNEKTNIFMFLYYLYISAINVYAINYKNSYSDIYRDHNSSIPCFGIYGDTLTYLSIGVLFTETLDIIKSIEDNNIFNYLSNLHTEYYNNYYNQLLDRDLDLDSDAGKKRINEEIYILKTNIINSISQIDNL